MKRFLTLFILCVMVSAACRKESAEQPAAAKSPEAQPAAPTNLVTIPSESPQLKQIKVEAVGSAEMPSEEVVSPGAIEANPNRISRVLLPVAGRITEVMVKIGDRVQAGQTLLTVESPDADAAIKDVIQAQAGLADAESELTKAQRDFDRLTDLYEHNAVAKKEVQSAEAGVAHARAGVEQAKALCDQTGRRLQLLGLEAGKYGQRIAVHAPIGGRILDLSVATGEYRNDTSTALMTIADLDTVFVSANVPESQIRFIKVGEGVTVELSAYPDESFPARVTRIADTVDPQTRTIKVQAVLKNDRERFRPAMFAQIRHEQDTAVVPVVPSQAVVQRDGRSIVLVEKATGSFELREVKLGQRANGRIAVTAGLTAGERIVTDGVMLLMKS